MKTAFHGLPITKRRPAQQYTRNFELPADVGVNAGLSVISIIVMCTVSSARSSSDSRSRRTFFCHVTTNVYINIALDIEYIDMSRPLLKAFNLIVYPAAGGGDCGGRSW